MGPWYCCELWVEAKDIVVVMDIVVDGFMEVEIGFLIIVIVEVGYSSTLLICTDNYHIDCKILSSFFLRLENLELEVLVPV